VRHLPSSSSLYHNIDSSLDEGLFDGDVGGIDGELACGNQGGRVLGYDDVADVDDEGKSVVDELWSDDDSLMSRWLPLSLIAIMSLMLLVRRLYVLDHRVEYNYNI
jgi:hypothetical protein